MAMRSQIYAWDLYGEGTAPAGPVSLLDNLSSIVTPGTLYTAFTNYSTQAVTGSGSGLGISVISVGGGGEVTALGVTSFAYGNGYKVGDIVRLIGGGSGNDCTIQIQELQDDSDEWTGPSVMDLGVATSIFTGGKGNNIKNKAKTKEMQFIVVENFGCTPTVFFPGRLNGATWPTSNYRDRKIKNALGGPRAYIQFIVNTTGYFKDSDGVPRNGLPGNVAPYPLTTQFSVCLERKQPPVYILPTQTWDMTITCFNDFLADGGRNQLHCEQIGQLQAFFKYTLYDGVDSIIALRLVESAISVTPENVDMFKRNLYERNITMSSNEGQANE
jgi:hypothetical protein